MGKDVKISMAKAMRDRRLREAARSCAETVKAQTGKRSQNIDGKGYARSQTARDYRNLQQAAGCCMRMQGTTKGRQEIAGSCRNLKEVA